MVYKEPKVTAEIDANLLNGEILAFYEVHEESETNYLMIATGQKLRSSVIVLDSDLKRKEKHEFDGCKISQVAETLYDSQFLFALNYNHNLIAINISLLS